MNQAIEFADGNRARAVRVKPREPVADLLAELGLRWPRAVMVLVGGDHEEESGAWDGNQILGLRHMLSRGFIKAAISVKALVLDLQASSQLAKMVGEGAAHRVNKPAMLGVAPAARAVFPGSSVALESTEAVPLEPNHGYHALVESEAPDADKVLLDRLSGELGQDVVNPDEPDVVAAGVPVVLVVVNGGAVAKDLVLRHVRRKKPVVLIEGSGGLADTLSALVKEKKAAEDPILAEIILDGKLRIHSLADKPELLEGRIMRALGDNPTIELAWRQFAQYDVNAVRAQRLFHRLQNSILALGVISTLIALTQTQIFQGQTDQSGAWSWLGQALHLGVVISPILISILISAANEFKAGQKYVTLRAAAEGIKREIYLYRAHAGRYAFGYADEESAVAGPRERLVERIRETAAQVMGSSVRESALRPYSGSLPPRFAAAEGDDGMSFLSPARYLAVRLVDQMTYYQSKTTKLEKRLARLQWGIYLFGGLGTLLAAVGLDLWIALTISIVAAITTYVEYQQISETLRKFNLTANDLGQILNWWNALPPSAQADPAKIDFLVVSTENTLASESADWVQRVKEAITELQTDQAEAGSGAWRVGADPRVRPFQHMREIAS